MPRRARRAMADPRRAEAEARRGEGSALHAARLALDAAKIERMRRRTSRPARQDWRSTRRRWRSRRADAAARRGEGVMARMLESKTMEFSTRSDRPRNRRGFIGGSDARMIMGQDEAALLRLWREKRGEAEPEDLSRNLLVQLGRATEDLNRRCYEANTQQRITDVQRHARHH